MLQLSDYPLHLSDNLVSEVKITKAPFNRSISGYGSKVPTQYMVRHATSKRWHRVYMIQYSNAGSAYIERHGNRYFLNPETEERLEALNVG